VRRCPHLDDQTFSYILVDLQFTDTITHDPIYALPASKHGAEFTTANNNNTVTYFTYFWQDVHDGMICVMFADANC